MRRRGAAIAGRVHIRLHLDAVLVQGNGAEDLHVRLCKRRKGRCEVSREAAYGIVGELSPPGQSFAVTVEVSPG